MPEFKLAIITLSLAILVGCAAVKPTCAVIDVAHAACEYVTVEYLDARDTQS